MKKLIIIEKYYLRASDLFTFNLRFFLIGYNMGVLLTVTEINACF